MSQNGYQDFFRAARKARGLPAGTPLVGKRLGANNQRERPRQSAVKVEEMSEAELRKAFGLKPTSKPKRASPGRRTSLLLPIGLSSLGLLVAGLFHFYPEILDGQAPKIELSLFAGALAEEKTAQAVPAQGGEKTQTVTDKKAQAASASAEKGNQELPDVRSWTPDELKFLARLDERNRELDEREQSLNKMEEDLRAQAKDIENKIKNLEEIRKQIAVKLQDKVEVDQERVGKLVEFYSNMKPQNAAKVFETIDEDLAVEVLIRMKKKDAADIMNLLPAKKSQVLSEKFAGYRSK